jgi:uncharacterized membrane protein YhhN
MPGVATALTLAMLAGLLVAERRRDARLRAVTKPLASLGFVLVPILGGARGGVATWILAGLVLGMAGDVLLMFRTRRAFLAGLGVFLLGHVAYVVAFAQLVPPAQWASSPMLPIVAAVAIAAVLVLRWLWPHLGSMTIPVVTYVAVIVTMLVGGIACARWAPLDGTARALIGAGAALFFASDLAVARERFVAEGFVNRAWGLPAYYVGQLLIAWSLVAR